MVILVFGLPGTGKTYFSEKLAEEINAVHLNTDLIREKLNFTGRYDEKTKQQVYNELFKKTQMEFRKGADVIVDGTFHKKRRREQVKNLTTAANRKIYFIEIKAEESTARKRLKEVRKHSDADLDVYEKIKSKFEVSADDCLELWSDDNDVGQMIEKAKKYING